MNPEIPAGQQAPESTQSVPPSPAPASPGTVPMPPATGAPFVESRSQAGLIIGIITGVVVLVAVAVVAWFFWFSPAAQAQRVSTAFMRAITDKDMDKVYELTNATDDSSKKFLQNAADKSEGNFTLKAKTMKGGVGYFLYDLSNKDGKQGRTTIEKQGGKYRVSSYVLGSDRLALVPGKSSDRNTQTTPSTQESTTGGTQTSTAAALACLTNSDYKWFSYDKGEPSVIYDTTYDPAKFTFNATGYMFFKPDTTDEDSYTTIYDDWADFAKHNADKQWKFRLEGSTYGPDAGTAASKQLASARSQKVKAQLVSRGVPEDRIIIDPSHNYDTEGQDDNVKGIYRRVQVTIDPTCTGSSANGGR